ncbi:secretory phospholipase A2 receptor-like [Hyposmocoma kahamanoa]|uniref:secretory phospholipase A2 receptor-like n=1 Tax=Hyposmocoma kahamanoa TaxID=1477025 RepID=UPI000E6D6CDE|nr:secretory phospholipase A2 receptor-like [Hyposmocoma kahamanoa]
MWRLFLLVYLGVIDARPSAREPPKFRPDYKYVAAVNGWLKLHRVPTDWFDARARCQLEGADLASPSDELMLQAMRSISNETSDAYCGFYTGIHSLFSKGDYTSIEGTPLWKMPVNFTKSQSCPKKIQNNDCTVLFSAGTAGSVDTVDCNQLYPFMCFRKQKKINNMCDCGTIDHEYKYYETTEQCYKFHRHPQTWPEAYKICLAEGGHLAVINKAEEAKVISSIFEEHPAYTMLSNYKDSLLLGFKKLQGTWTTIHGQSLEQAGYSNWSPKQPDSSTHPNPGGTKEYCGAMFRTGLLDDVWCDVQYPFICERNVPDTNEEVAIYNSPNDQVEGSL